MAETLLKDPENDLDVTTTQFDLAPIYMEQNLLDRARTLVVITQRVRKKELGWKLPHTLASTLRLALIYYKQRQFQAAGQVLSSLKSVIEPALGAEDLKMLSLASDVASALDDQGRHGDAEHRHSQTLKTIEGRLGHEHNSTLAYMENLSCTLVHLGKFDEAEVLQRYVINEGEAYTYHKKGLYQDAMALGETVTKEMEDVVGKEHPSTLATLDNLVLTYQKMHRFRDADKIGADVLEHRHRVFGEGDIETLRSKAHLALTYSEVRDHEKAEKLTDEVLKEGRKALGEAHPTMLTWLNTIAAVLLETGYFDKAEQLMKTVLGSMIKVLGPKHPETIVAMCNLAMCYKQQERFEEAFTLMTEITELTKRWPVGTRASYYAHELVQYCNDSDWPGSPSCKIRSGSQFP
ncbi:hypothetical protein AU210_016482 [Fusarium oxysporum f. sp. radicis-cucumerinum]|uniref:Kinesin light chain n=1 Tax=Fusarium oxysporum f. sp. radicis-cucumerinum TaxID=327505 RepID=A0A2H3FPL7_FUSOX|nr:hypothetical protein AU210_016482 [Fusarium oxysporum f. sp. radicis-cucumerinum]